MTPETSKVSIDSGDYWFKIIESLQQNWALINRQHSGVIVWFFGDTSGVFDDMTFASAQEAETALRHNSFSRFTEDAKAQQFIVGPVPHSTAVVIQTPRSIRESAFGSNPHVSDPPQEVD